MTHVDFLPDRIKAQRARLRRLAVQGGLLALCLLCLAALAYVFDGRVRRARAELTMLAERGQRVGDQLQLRVDLESQLADLMIKQRIEEQLGRRVGTLYVLGELQRVMPESMALTSLKMETVSVAVPARRPRVNGNRALAYSKSQETARVKRVRLVLTGMAPTDVDVANFIGQLAASPVFEDVDMGYAKTIEFRGRTARDFEASCFVTR